MTRLRQKQLLLVASGLLVILAIGLLVVGPILRGRQRLDKDTQRGEKRLRDLVRLEETYRQLLSENAKLAKSLRGREQNFTLFAFLEGLARREGLKKQIEFMRPSVKPLSETYQEDQVEMRLKGVSLEKLIPYLYHIETSPEQVRIKRLTIKSQRRDQSLLEVSLVVVTRGLQKSSPSTAG